MKLLTATVAGVMAGAITAGLTLLAPGHRPTPRSLIETVTIQPTSFAYRLPGEFLMAGRVVDGALRKARLRHALEIMTYQVSAAEYGACVAEDACRAADGSVTANILPVTGVSYLDAVKYADWLSFKTGERWRLPTDEEWIFAAAERFGDDALGSVGGGKNDPAARWLAAYQGRNAREARDAIPKSKGYFGANTLGLYDIGGNVWEWTSTCYTRTHVDPAGRTLQGTENCGVRVIGGKHRGYMTNFLRDGKSGGCAAGMAPDNLGFRLVRDPASSIARRLWKHIVRV
jgi:formylglycine-generating enzyme required for sulfatase activity